MGLDVYLYRSTSDKKKIEKLKEEYEKGHKKNWEGKDYDKLTDKEKESLWKKDEKLALSLGLDKNAEDKNEEEVEINSKKYPEHYFKVGYFRSSYNDGGINQVLGNTIGKDLYYIFEPGDEYEITPDWKKARIRAKEVYDEYDKFLKEKGNLRCSFIRLVSYGTVKLPSSDQEAIAAFLSEVDKKEKAKGPFDSYSNALGDFFLKDPARIKALIKGKKYGNDLGLYMIEEIDGKIEDDWYLQALEIVIETIDYVLAQKDKKNYYFHWSG